MTTIARRRRDGQRDEAPAIDDARGLARIAVDPAGDAPVDCDADASSHDLPRAVALA